MDPDPDLGDPKTYGSDGSGSGFGFGSATLPERKKIMTVLQSEIPIVRVYGAATERWILKCVQKKTVFA
jgi:hypothetical protein